MGAEGRKSENDGFVIIWASAKPFLGAENALGSHFGEALEFETFGIEVPSAFEGAVTIHHNGGISPWVIPELLTLAFNFSHILKVYSIEIREGVRTQT